MLSALSRGGVGFVVVGPAAAIAHGAELSSEEGRRLDLVPEEAESNLARLGAVLTDRLAACLRVEVDGRYWPARFDAAVLRAFSLLPLVTSAGEVNIVTRPEQTCYEALARDAVSAVVAGVEVRVASIGALLAGLPGSSRPANPLVVSELRRLRIQRRLLEFGVAEDEAVTGLSPDERRALAWTVHGVLARSSEPLTVRQILARLGGPDLVSYVEVRRVADELTTRGVLRRSRSGSSNKYVLNDAYDGQAAREISGVLRRTRDPRDVVERALSLLGTEVDSGDEG